MIRFLTTRANRRTIESYLRTHGAKLAGTIVPERYDRALEARDLPAGGTWCFADLELLTDAERARAVALWDRLAARGARLLNHPARTLRRHDLLKMLHARGVNRFDVHRAGAGPVAPRRWPVFLRGEHDHFGARTAPLCGPAELEAALEATRRARGTLDDTLVVELCETADAAGVYRKYGAFIVGDRIIARHVFFSRRWVVKKWDLTDEALLAEERRYVALNPHEAALREVFAAAGVDYGRADYSILDGALQVWEVNTNPRITGLEDDVSALERLRRGVKAAGRALLGRPAKPRPRATLHVEFAARLAEVWAAVDSPTPAAR